MPTQTDYTQEAKIISDAHEAGCKAVEALEVPAMMVTDGKHSWHVSDGVCGFAWVTVKPANSKIAKYMKDVIRIANKSVCEPGIKYWISAYNQSMHKKEAYAYAFAKVLQENGIKAYAGSRMD